MNFSQLHERLRLEVLRRIDRGALSGSLLARQTGFPQSHISNFLHRKRTLSIEGADRLLAAQMLSVADLADLESAFARNSRPDSRLDSRLEAAFAPAPAPTPPTHPGQPGQPGQPGHAHPTQSLPNPQQAPGVAAHGLAIAHGVAPTPFTSVPIVTHSAAIHEPQPPPHATIDLFPISSRLLAHLRSRRAASRRSWLRFVAIRVSAQQAAGMDPLLATDALAVLDRHYNSLQAYHPFHPTLYAVRAGNQLLLRYASFELNRLILRPYSLSQPVRLLTLGPQETPSDLIVGRLCFTLSAR
jgi:hypothetical protein